MLVSYLEEEVCEAAVALDLDIGEAGGAGREMAGQRTGVFTAWRSLSLTGRLALLTVDPRTPLVRRLSDLVTVSLTPVVPAGQSSPALPPTGGRLGGVAGPAGGLVAARTGHSDGVTTGRAGGRLRPELRPSLLPGPHRPGPGLHPDPDLLVTGGRAAVGAGQQSGALLSAGRTGPAVAEMRGHLLVVTVRGGLAQLLAPRASRRLLPAAGNLELGLPAVARQADRQLAGIAGAGVTSYHGLSIITRHNVPYLTFNHLPTN